MKNIVMVLVLNNNLENGKETEKLVGIYINESITVLKSIYRHHKKNSKDVIMIGECWSYKEFIRENGRS